MASCLLLFYSTSLYAIYGGTDGGANEEATSQFYSRAICSKLNPTFAVKFIINLNLRLCNYYKLSPTMFHSVWCQIPWHGGFIRNSAKMRGFLYIWYSCLSGYMKSNNANTCQHIKNSNIIYLIVVFIYCIHFLILTILL